MRADNAGAFNVDIIFLRVSIRTPPGVRADRARAGAALTSGTGLLKDCWKFVTSPDPFATNDADKIKAGVSFCALGDVNAYGCQEEQASSYRPLDTSASSATWERSAPTWPQMAQNPLAP